MTHPAGATPLPAGGDRQWRPFPELLQLADQEGFTGWHRVFDPQIALRQRYCDIVTLPARAGEPCTSCGGPCTQLVGGMFLHLTCPDPDKPRPAARRPSSGQAATAPRETARPGGGPRRDSRTETPDLLAGVLAADGLWLPGARQPLPVDVPQDAAAAYTLASQHRLRQLWIHPGVHDAAGLPSEHGPNPQAPEPHPWTDVPGFALDPPGLAAWLWMRPAGEEKRRAIVLPAYEHRASWRKASSGQVLLDAVVQLAAALPPGCNYYYSPNQTTAAVIRHHTRGELATSTMPPPAADRVVRHVITWSRQLLDEEVGATWLHRYDRNGDQLAVWNVKLGRGEPVHLDAPTWTRGKSKYTAGYWLIAVADGWIPDQRLPNLRRPWDRAREEYVWVPTPFLELLADDLNTPITIAEAWVWPESSAWLEASGHSLRDARATLLASASSDEAAELAYDTVKVLYSSGIGEFARRRDSGADEIPPSDPLWRPDANDHIISKALANGYRRMRKIGAQSGRWPVALHNDAVYYASDSLDPRSAVPTGMVIGTGLGQYKVEPDGTVPLAAVTADLGERSFDRAVARAARGRS